MYKITFNVDIANGDVGGNSRAFTSNSFSTILPVKVTSFGSHNWLDRLYLIRILEKKLGVAVGLLKHPTQPVCSIKTPMTWYYSFTLTHSFRVC